MVLKIDKLRHKSNLRIYNCIMDTYEFESLVEGASESASLDFKTAMNWSKSLIKDILAMSNIQDGGRIVVGISDDLNRVGLSEEQIASFNEESIKDQVAEYADPYVSFNIKVAKDRNGLKYMVISVNEFDEIPIICRRDGEDIKRGDIYYRSKSGRSASKRIANEYDMRDILDRAAVKLMSKRRNQGYQPQEASFDQIYETERGGL